MTNRTKSLRSKKLRTLWVGALVLLAAVELIWLAGANWALSSEYLAARINRRPDKLKVEWTRAHSVIPGLISVEGLSARGQSRKQQWYLELDRARLHLSLAALARRTFKTYSLRVSGLDFRSRKRLDAGEAPPPLAEFWPPIPGLAADAPAPLPSARKARAGRPWVLSFGGLRIDGVRQIWISPYRIAGRGTIRADLQLEVRGPMSLDAVAALRGAEIFARGSRIAEDLRLDVEASLDPFRPAETKGLAVLRSLSGSLSLAGRSTTAGLLNRILASSGAIEVGDTGGAVTGELLVERGKLRPGSHFALTPKDGWLEFLDWRARGAIDARFEVREGEEADPALLTLSLAGVDVVDRRIDLPVLEGASVELAATLEELDLAAGVPGLDAALVSIDLDLTGATVADITRFPIPPVEDFSLASGRLAVDGHAVIRRTIAEARLEVSGEGIAATYGNVAIRGNLAIELQAATPDLASRHFTLADSSMRIDDVTIGEGEQADTGWYAQLDIRDGALSLSEPREIGGGFELQMRDSRPIIAILQHRRPILGRLRGILDFTDLTGTARISAAADGLVVEEVDLTGDGLHVMTRLRVADDRASGILYSRFHGIALGVDLRGEKADFIVLRPKRWYEAQKAVAPPRP